MAKNNLADPASGTAAHRGHSIIGSARKNDVADSLLEVLPNEEKGVGDLGLRCKARVATEGRVCPKLLGSANASLKEWKAEWRYHEFQAGCLQSESRRVFSRVFGRSL